MDTKKVVVGIRKRSSLSQKIIYFEFSVGTTCTFSEATSVAHEFYDPKLFDLLWVDFLRQKLTPDS